jgi:hypothetical protein
MRIAALDLRNSFGKPASDVFHLYLAAEPDHKEILCHTSRAKLQ